METTCFQPIKDKTDLKLLNLRSNIKENMLCALFPSYFLKNERKPSKAPHTSLLMLNESNDNSWATTKSSSIKSYKLNEIPDLKKKFKLIVIVTFKALKSNQCPRN
jgi:hypothetical protein